MEYEFEIWTIEKLINIIDDKKIDLNPPYQRNFIWSPKDQSSLIESIDYGYPLPAFFIYLRENGVYEVVDGQQRSRTIYRFWKGLIKGKNKKTIKDIDKESFLSYKLNITRIFNLQGSDSLEIFYSLVNKSGKHLNPAELNKAAYYGKNLLQLAEDLLDEQDLIELDLFSGAMVKRMNDRAYIEELVSFLKYGFTDKKKAVEKLYKEDIAAEEYETLKASFNKVISLINYLNKDVYPINKTRYRQKSDFYTLFSFIYYNQDQSYELLKRQYDFLILLDGYISPTNEECEPLQKYALNCVSQSNSANARKNRYNFFENILKNTQKEDNEQLNEILNYIERERKISLELVEVDGYYLPKKI